MNSDDGGARGPGLEEAQDALGAAAGEAGEYQDPPSFSLDAAGHSFHFLPGGAQRLEALLAMIGEAKARIAMCYYMFEPDESGEMVRAALVEAEQRGVKVQLIVDGFGTSADEEFFAPLCAAGAEICVFNPRWTVRYLIRNHQKFLVIDEQEAMIGGANIANDYFAPPGPDGWCDLAVRLRGPVVADFTLWFSQLFTCATSERPFLREVRRLIRDWQPRAGPVQLLLGGPTRIPSTWARRIKSDMNRATRLDLAMAYFSPPRSFRRVMARVGKHGAARIILPSKSDNGATIGAARLLYQRFLRARVRLYEFLPSKLHMKLAVIDSTSYFGSANFDMRSIRVNLETMLRIESEELAAALRSLLDHMQGASEAITPAVHRRQKSPLRWLQWRLSWALVVVLDYTVSRRVNAGL